MTEFTLRSRTPEAAKPLATDPGLGQTLVRKAGIAVAGSALVALSAHVSIPLGFTPVPFTLQPFAVLLLGLLLDPVTAFATLALYLAEGAAGMPVFSPHGPGGVAQLAGLTGGYLMAAPVASAATSLLSRMHKSFAAKLVSAAVGDAILLISGAAWLGVLTHATLRAVAAQGITPFLLTDSIKVLAAAVCAGILLSFRAPRAHRHAR
jgi:biotin transport system substrate-specific component